MDSNGNSVEIDNRVSAMLSVARRLLCLTIAMVIGGAIWYGLVWGLIEGYKYVGR